MCAREIPKLDLAHFGGGLPQVPSPELPPVQQIRQIVWATRKFGQILDARILKNVGGFVGKDYPAFREQLDVRLRECAEVLSSLAGGIEWSPLQDKLQEAASTYRKACRPPTYDEQKAADDGRFAIEIKRLARELTNPGSTPSTGPEAAPLPVAPDPSDERKTHAGEKLLGLADDLEGLLEEHIGRAAVGSDGSSQQTGGITGPGADSGSHVQMVADGGGSLPGRDPKANDSEAGGAIRMHMDDHTLLSCASLAKRYKVPVEALRKRLERHRTTDHDCFVEQANRSSKEPQFLYYGGKVVHIVDQLKSSPNASAKRPS